MSPVAVYVHIPFCPSKCGYCDFNSFALEGEIVNQTVNCIVQEIRNSPWAGRPAKTIFFGGGTPTFIAGDSLCHILAEVMRVHPPIPGCEITSEANPGTVDSQKFDQMVSGGFNRLSLGAQSFNNEDLMQLGRVHRATEIARAVFAARSAGFKNLNLDLMFALPGQSEFGWKRNLDTALELAPDHLSLYGLTIESNTRFDKYHRRGMLDLPDDERQVEMYNLAMEMTHAAGFQQYEISNFAKPGRECQHNLCYWNAEEYIGYGPGAVGAFNSEGARIRYVNMKHPARYCDCVQQGKPLWCEEETLDDATLKTERIMLGMRLNRGMDSHNLDAESVNQMVNRGWCELKNDRVHLTPSGKHYCSEVVLALI